MKVDLLNREMVDSDLGVVNAARCSFDKESTWLGGEGTQQLKEGDVKLITYLATHHHWTPFAHPQEVFSIHLTGEEMLYFLVNANLSGFEWLKTLGPFTVRGSLYAWLTNSTWLPEDISADVRAYIHARYPVSYNAVKGGYVSGKPRERAIAVHQVIKSDADELQSFTLRIHAPIFVKRQMETHRRNFVMTDIEDFSQNEVSRRYVDSEPEFYTPVEWRIQAKDKKQGSSDEKIDGLQRVVASSYYYTHLYNANSYYRVFNSYNIAHEQSRMVLPLSTYTTWWWTGSVKSWKRMVALRLDTHAQSETRELAQLICEAIPVPL